MIEEVSNEYVFLKQYSYRDVLELQDKYENEIVL